ncbi:hypothetical protein ACWKC5_004981 [Escherichia coli]|uniref:hypothetical protein n=1 Tax=Escherichia coli TaxID=562 RepID=UPI001177BC2A|nr:hypothetical protein [Escherichia coli]EGK3604794.1 hypothetical protein [Escherichia coli]EJJ0330429.1 hypothetical protein [Escherichia coli]EKY5129002.1 hypothetical protein [Escherichia coli]HCQ0487071.1 hypothetical protein [Escherichia coli]HDX6611059.1 hypothetical protein [Escherichia coli]
MPVFPSYELKRRETPLAAVNGTEHLRQTGGAVEAEVAGTGRNGWNTVRNQRMLHAEDSGMSAGAEQVVAGDTRHSQGCRDVSRHGDC